MTTVCFSNHNITNFLRGSLDGELKRAARRLRAPSSCPAAVARLRLPSCGQSPSRAAALARLQEFNPELWPKPADNLPVIESIEIMQPGAILRFDLQCQSRRLLHVFNHRLYGKTKTQNWRSRQGDQISSGQICPRCSGRAWY